MLNNVVLMGRLTADPELRHTPSNIAVTSFTLAVNRSYVKTGTERQTDFIDIVAWRTTAEFVCKYFKKGQLVAVQGSIQTSSYQDKEGNKRKSVEVLADSVYFAESRKDNNSNQGYSDNRSSEADFADSYENGNKGDFEEIQLDDDLPF